MSGKIPTTINSSSNLLNSSSSSAMNTSFTNSAASGGMGRPVQIVDITSDHKFKLNEENLLSILNHPKARMRKVCVVSVAGAFRKGKSFLLDFYLRYLTRNGREDWMGGDDEPLTGFHWKGGSERDTTGILMWSEPFLLKRNESKEDVCLFLIKF
jgi:atlastin